MKISFYSKLALDSIRKNKQMYVPYILTGAVMVMMFYILSSLMETPALEDIHGGALLMYILPLGCVVIAVFSLLFLVYTNSFLMKQRYREFGIYNVLGMDKRNISRLMMWETIYTAMLAIGGGLLCGILLSKAAELILLNILKAEISFAIYIGIHAILRTIGIYSIIYGILLVSSLIKIVCSNPLELMQSSKVGEKRLKCNWLFAIAGVVLLIWAYDMAVSIEEPATAMLLFFAAVIMVIAGTYLLFISGSVAICRLLQKNKKYYYKPNHFVSVSSMAYRMKRNGAGLASICILLTMVLVMLSSTATLYFGEEASIRNRYPHSINLTMYFDTIDGIGDENLDAQRDIIAQYAPADAELSGTRYAMAAGQFTDEGIILDYTNVAAINYDKVGYLYILSIEDYNSMMGTDRTLAEGECLIYSNRLDTQWDTFAMESGKVCRVRERLDDFREDGEALAMTMPSVYLVVNDVYAFTEPVIDLKNDQGNSLIEYEWLCGFDLPTAEEELAAKDGIQDAINSTAEEEHTWSRMHLESREEERFRFYEMYGSLFFLGIMLSVVFLLAAVLIIYYKQISEGYEDQNRFEIMQKVGMTKRDIRRSINSQMLTVFFLPLAVAGLHLAFAFPFVSKILVLFAFDDMLLNITVTVSCFAVFGLFYAIVYKITSGRYYAIVSGSEHVVI